MTDTNRCEMNASTWYSRAMDKPQEQPLPVPRDSDASIRNNGFLVSETAKAKNRALFWKRLWVAECNRNGSNPKPYSAREMDHAASDEPFWSADANGQGTVIAEYQS